MNPPTSAAPTHAQGPRQMQNANPRVAAAGMMAGHQAKYPIQKSAEASPASSRKRRKITAGVPSIPPADPLPRDRMPGEPPGF